MTLSVCGNDPGENGVDVSGSDLGGTFSKERHPRWDGSSQGRSLRADLHILANNYCYLSRVFYGLENKTQHASGDRFFETEKPIYYYL